MTKETPMASGEVRARAREDADETAAEIVARMSTPDRIAEVCALLDRLEYICDISPRCNTPEGAAVKAIVPAPILSAINEGAFLAYATPFLLAALATSEARIAELTAERDALREACRLIVLYDEREDEGPNAGLQMMVDYDNALTTARAALASSREAGE